MTSTSVSTWIQARWKTVTALAGAILVIANQFPIANFVPPQYRHWVDVIIAFATAIAVHQVPNVDPQPLQAHVGDPTGDATPTDFPS